MRVFAPDYPPYNKICDRQLLINDYASTILLILVAHYHLQPVWHLLAIIIITSNDKHFCPFSFIQSPLPFAPFDLDQTVACIYPCNLLTQALVVLYFHLNLLELITNYKLDCVEIHIILVRIVFPHWKD